MSHTQQRGRGNSSQGSHGRGRPRHASQNSQENQNEMHPTNNQRGRSSYRGLGHGFTQRGRGQQPRGGNRGYNCAQGTSRDVSHSYGGYNDHTQGGGSMPKPQQEFLDFPFIEEHETVGLLPQFRVMFILRGLPGSGKSTIADAILQQYKDQAVVCSADYYLYNEDGEYIWTEETLQEAQSKCQKRANRFCALSKPVIIIDNTNVRHIEVEPYIKLAKWYGYVVVLVEPRTPWKFQARELTTRNSHDVSSTKICKMVEEYDEILPVYFGWFVSPGDRVKLQTMAKDVLQKCLQITKFQQCIKTFSGRSSPKFTVHNALSYYSIRQNYNVTACFSPCGKYLAGSLDHKSQYHSITVSLYHKAVEKTLVQISLVSIIGCVLTNKTMSARVSLTKKQRELWMNDDRPVQTQRRRGHATRHSVKEMTSSFQNLPLEDGARALSERPEHCTNASTHITLGTREGVKTVQAKYDVQTVINYEHSTHVFEEYTLPGDIGKVRKYTKGVWAVYFNKAHIIKVLAIFSGYYDR